MGAPQKAFPIAMSRLIPETEGSRAYPVSFDFTSVTAASININLSDTGLSAVKTMFVDNSNGIVPAFFAIPGIGEIIVCPAYSQGFFPFLSPGLNLQVNATSAGANLIPCLFLNVEIGYAVWSMQGSAGTTIVSGTVTTSPLAGSFVAANLSLAAGGAPQGILATQAGRKRLIIQNPLTAAGQGIAAAETLYFQFASNPGIDNGTGFELQPGGSYDTGSGPCPTDAVAVIATTTGHRVICRYML